MVYPLKAPNEKRDVGRVEATVPSRTSNGYRSWEGGMRQWHLLEGKGKDYGEGERKMKEAGQGGEELGQWSGKRDSYCSEM